MPGELVDVFTLGAAIAENHEVESWVVLGEAFEGFDEQRIAFGGDEPADGADDEGVRRQATGRFRLLAVRRGPEPLAIDAIEDADHFFGGKTVGDKVLAQAVRDRVNELASAVKTAALLEALGMQPLSLEGTMLAMEDGDPP